MFFERKHFFRFFFFSFSELVLICFLCFWMCLSFFINKKKETTHVTKVRASVGLGKCRSKHVIFMAFWEFKRLQIFFFSKVSTSLQQGWQWRSDPVTDLPLFICPATEEYEEKKVYGRYKTPFKSLIIYKTLKAWKQSAEKKREKNAKKKEDET